MFSSVELPFWAVLLMVFGCALAAWSGVLVPSVRWFFRRRVNRVIDELNTRLRVNLRPFQHTKKQVLIDRLVYDPQVIERIEHLASEQHKPRQVLHADALIYAKEIIPSFNAYVYYRIGYWLAKRVSHYLYRIKIAASDRHRIEAIDPEATVVFVMNHRSNMDYVLVSYLLAEKIVLSYAVGEWARVFPLQTLISAMGAFFVRRNSGDPLYRKVLERYVHMATEQGVCQAVFLEGGLTRDGLMAAPKLGFLDYMVRHFNTESSRDIVFVPIALNYDRVIEDRQMLTWDRERSRPFRHWARLLTEFAFSSKDGRRRRLGYASLNFGLPLSCRAFCEEENLDFGLLEKKRRFVYVQQLAEQLREEILRVMPVLPVPLVARVLIEHLGQPLRSVEVVYAVNALIERLIVAGAAMQAKHKPRAATVHRALDLLIDRGLIQEQQDLHQANPEALELLDYYANSIGHWLASPAHRSSGELRRD